MDRGVDVSQHLAYDTTLGRFFSFRVAYTAKSPPIVKENGTAYRDVSGMGYQQAVWYLPPLRAAQSTRYVRLHTVSHTCARWRVCTPYHSMCDTVYKIVLTLLSFASSFEGEGTLPFLSPSPPRCVHHILCRKYGY